MRLVFVIFLPLLIQGCAYLGIQSAGPSSVEIRDTDSVQHFRYLPQITHLMRQKNVFEWSPKTIQRQYTGYQTVDSKLYDDDVVFGLSVSGGGARAAAYTLGVLEGLSEIKNPQLEGHTALEAIDFVSSNSGGSWGIVSYLGDRLSRQGDPCEQYNLKARRRDISRMLAKTTRAGGLPRNRMKKFIDHLGGGKKYKDLGSDCLFDPYINAAISSSQSPFVFTQDYIDHFRIREFLTPGQKPSCANGNTATCYDEKEFWIGELSLGQAAFISGAVPGWYHAKAVSSLCDDGELSLTYYCKENRRNLVRLVDGGIYDNYGYKTAFELLSHIGTPKSQSKKLLIQVDTTTNLPYVTNSSGNDIWEILRFARSSSFPNQDATFQRMFEPLARQQNVDTLLLDLFSTSYCRNCDTDESLLKGLNALKDFASKLEYDQDANSQINYEGNELVVSDPSDNIYWRAGMLAKTTFLFDYIEGETPAEDAGMGTIMWQLGILAIRLESDYIRCALFGVDMDTQPCQSVDYDQTYFEKELVDLKQELERTSDKKFAAELRRLIVEFETNIWKQTNDVTNYHYVECQYQLAWEYYNKEGLERDKQSLEVRFEEYTFNNPKAVQISACDLPH